MMVLSATVILLSGWFESPMALFGILLVPALVLALVQFCVGLKAAGRIERVVLVVLLTAAAATVLLAWPSNWMVVGVLAGFFGYRILTWFDPSDPAHPQRGRDETFKMIAEPVRTSMDAAPEAAVTRFKPSFPVETDNEATIWAIDPARRALRVMAPANAAVDEVVEWDEPIRSVTLKRAKLSWWLPSMDSRLRAARRDRDLEIVSGWNETATWRYVFQFQGPSMASHWRDVFESWMIKDRERVQA